MATITSLQDDKSVLTEARNKVEELRLWVETELDRAKVGSCADDALESLHHELENRRASLNATLDELQDEINALPSESAADLKWHQARVA